MPLPLSKKYTADEFLAMTDLEGRYELIDGEIYDMSPAPGYLHQDIAGGVYRKTGNYIEANKGKCRVYIAPADVKLDSGNVVQPDVFVICDKDKLDGKYYNGAPDWVVEVLSPSTSRHDMSTKLGLYKTAGVREYWIIDPIDERVIVYPFADGTMVGLYSFDDDIPVGIYRDYDPPLTLRIKDLIPE